MRCRPATTGWRGSSRRCGATPVWPERFAASGANEFTGEVIESVYLGTSFKLRLACEGGLELLVRQPARGALPAAGARVSVGIDPEAIHVF